MEMLMRVGGSIRVGVVVEDGRGDRVYDRPEKGERERGVREWEG